MMDKRSNTALFLGLAGVATVLVGCKPVEPAPEDLDGLFHWLWLHYDDAGDAEYAAAVLDLAEVGDAEQLVAGEAVDGQLSQTNREALDVVGMREDADPEQTQGMYLLNRFACDLPTLDQVLIALDQMANYDSYDSYERSYTSDADAYLARQEPTVGFVSDLGASILGANYTSSVHGNLRWIPGEESPNGGPVLAARYWIPEPAEFGNDDFYFRQDYQIEVFYEEPAGEIVHLYGLWREQGLNDLGTDSEFIQRQILNALADWDLETADACASRN